jgi:ribosomal protein S18 acetylase RimI-like enzyme
MSMVVRTISEGELSDFSAFAAEADRGFAPKRKIEFEKWLQGLWQRGESSPGHCFVLEQEGKRVGAMVCWLRGDGVHLEHIQCAGEEPGVLEFFVRETLAALAARKVRLVWAELPSPPLDEWRRTFLAEALRGAGLSRRRCGVTYLRPAVACAMAGRRLTFRSVTEVGREEFVAAFGRMTADSLDSMIVTERGKKGAAQYAVDELADQALTPHEDVWWEIGFDASGDAVGLVMPGIVGRQAAILFVAVEPRQRGRKYARDLVARGIESLQADGIRSVRADVDEANVPMIRALESMGFERKRSNWWYECELQ